MLASPWVMARVPSLEIIQLGSGELTSRPDRAGVDSAGGAAGVGATAQASAKGVLVGATDPALPVFLSTAGWEGFETSRPDRALPVF